MATKKSAKPAKEEVPCPVCESNEKEVLYEPWLEVEDPVALYGAASGVQGTQRLVKCRSCSMIFESPRFPEKVILQGYSSSDEAGHDSQHEMRVQSFYRSLQSLKDRIPAKGAKILDVGTAGGAFLDAAERFGYEAVGLEPSQFLVDRAQKRGLDVRQGTLDNMPFENASFDMICLWDVLEHVANPLESLKQVSRILKPTGVLLINYPDIGTPMAKLAGKRFWWILSVHLHHFSRRTLSQLCERAGFSVVHFQKYWQTLQLGYLEDMAIHLKVPLSRPLKKLTPAPLQRIPLPYYASQTTAIVRLNQ